MRTAVHSSIAAAVCSQWRPVRQVTRRQERWWWWGIIFLAPSIECYHLSRKEGILKVNWYYLSIYVYLALKQSLKTAVRPMTFKLIVYISHLYYVMLERTEFDCTAVFVGTINRINMFELTSNLFEWANFVIVEVMTVFHFWA